MFSGVFCNGFEGVPLVKIKSVIPYSCVYDDSSVLKIFESLAYKLERTSSCSRDPPLCPLGEVLFLYSKGIPHALRV